GHWHSRDAPEELRHVALEVGASCVTTSFLQRAAHGLAKPAPPGWRHRSDTTDSVADIMAAHTHYPLRRVVTTSSTLAESLARYVACLCDGRHRQGGGKRCQGNARRKRASGRNRRRIFTTAPP